MQSARPLVCQGGLVLLLSWCLGATIAADISDYEYMYDELPREHLAPLTRYGREARAGPAENVQHVPADAPRSPQDTLDLKTVIQRVPRRAREEDADAAIGRPVPTAAQGTDPEVESEPTARVEGSEEIPQTQPPPQLPAAVPDSKLAKESMETANFLWGLGPVYPHLYVYRRVPHLVPLHGWNPYHAYLLTHPPQ